MTTAVALTDAWAAVVAGDDSTKNLQNTGLNPVKYRVATTGAQTGVAGHWLKRYDTHPIFVPTGSSLYARVFETGSGEVTYSETA